MNRLVIGCLTGLILIVAVVFLLWDRTPNEADQNRRLSEDFMACLSPELMSEQRQEISDILNRFFDMARRGEVEPADLKSVQKEMKNHILVGSISQSDLEHFMARVSYLTYKSNPDANLPDGVIDHPILNPDSS
jgi:hypothetical protein